MSLTASPEGMAGKIAVSASGRLAAACSWLHPIQDTPNMPTLSVDQGCSTIQSMTSL
jgi:hypothetical protein